MKNNKNKKMKYIKMSIEEFIEKYYNEYLEEKYGDEWRDVVLNELLENNISIEFIG